MQTHANNCKHIFQTFQAPWRSTAKAALLWVFQGMIWGSTSPAHSHRIIPSQEKLAPFLHGPFFDLLMRIQIWFCGFAMSFGINMYKHGLNKPLILYIQSTVQAFGTTKLLWHDLGMQARFRHKKWHRFHACLWLLISLGIWWHLQVTPVPGSARRTPIPRPSNAAPKHLRSNLDGLPPFRSFRQVQVDSAQGGQRKFPVGVCLCLFLCRIAMDCGQGFASCWNEDSRTKHFTCWVSLTFYGKTSLLSFSSFGLWTMHLRSPTQLTQCWLTFSLLTFISLNRSLIEASFFWR